MESALIFTYGVTNIFLEHLDNWGGEYSPEDLEHVSITVLFIGGGLVSNPRSRLTLPPTFQDLAPLTPGSAACSWSRHASATC